MRRKAILAAVGLSAVAAALGYRRIGFRPPERAELEYEDGSVVALAGAKADPLAAHAREALAAARG